jgi:UPF0176 protein
MNLNSNSTSQFIKNKNYVNLAFYKFVSLPNWELIQRVLNELCLKLSLRGTILLSEEGINSCVVGTRDNADAFVLAMRTNDILASVFSNIDFKESYSADIPFARMYVKYRSEIVTMGQPNIDPEHFTGDYVEPLELKKWLDTGENVVLVDTRNDYELRLGTFERAIDPNIKTFREFPDWVEKNKDLFSETAQGAPKIVTFCTGGIRCEKATAYMRQQGLENVYQLHGGLLKYFEETKRLSEEEKKPVNNHFNGDCFVFDYRVAVDKNLEKTDVELCYNCRAPLTGEDKASEHYKFEVQCPYCVGERQQKLARVREKIQLKKVLFSARKEKRSSFVKESRTLS